MYSLIIVDDELKIREGIANLFPWKQNGFEITGLFPNGQLALDSSDERAGIKPASGGRISRHSPRISYRLPGFSIYAHGDFKPRC